MEALSMEVALQGAHINKMEEDKHLVVGTRDIYVEIPKVDGYEIVAGSRREIDISSAELDSSKKYCDPTRSTAKRGRVNVGFAITFS